MKGGLSLSRPTLGFAGSLLVGANPRFAAMLLLIALASTPREPYADPRAQSGKSRPATADKAGPSAVLERFDSLLEAGSVTEARLLCAGQMLRMFDFIALAQSKMTGLVDTARSSEAILKEEVRGKWAYVKVSSRMVFNRPFMGHDSMSAVQAAHLYRSERGWLITEMEELAGPASPVRLRMGIPQGSEGSLAANPDSAGAKSATGGIPAQLSLFPVSTRAPEKSGEADRLRFRLKLRNGGSLAETFPMGPRQGLIRAVSASEWILENRRPRGKTRPASSLAGDSLKTYLASNAFLVLDDTLLQQTAALIAPGEKNPGVVTQGVYDWVTSHFRFQLGAVLFGTSSEILRNLTGDCSEAAVLTAALLRARGVPARVALGFASLGRGVFIGHAWTEARLDGGWVGVDAALREFPAGVERVKLAELDGKSDMRIAAVNLMMRALSNLDIEIEGAWKNGKPLPLRRFPDNSAEAGRFFQEILDGIEREKRQAD